MKKLFSFLAVLLSLAFVAAAQTPSGGNEATSREQQLRDEIKVLKAQIDLLNTIKSAAASSNISAATSGGSTSFQVGQQPNMETVSLSYEAVDEISRVIDHELKPTISQYRALVFYHEPDFLALTRYRLYREQVRMALANYDDVVNRIKEEAEKEKARQKNDSGTKSFFGGEALVTALGAPSIATSAIKSVAELASLFRTEQVITESKDVVDKDSLGTVVAGTMMKANPGLVVYDPEQFVAEYDIGIRDENSLYSQLSRVNAAEAFLNYFLDEMEKLPAPERQTPPLNRIIAAAKVVQKQIANLGLSYSTERGVGVGGDQNSSPRVSEFRAMLRAEKLERVMTSGRVGVLKLRLLSSGGARREKRNLLLGAKMDYSGSAVVEVILYDADGTLRASEVFSYHTGFRKFKTGDKPRL